MIETHNKRICGLVGRSVLFESYDSNFVRSAFSRDRSDPAAYAKHYELLNFLEERVKKKLFLVFLLIFILLISCNSRDTKNKNNKNDVFNEVWSFTMKYGEDNSGYSVESQINLIVQIMVSQDTWCYVTDQLVTPSIVDSTIYNVSLKIVCPDTNEESEYEWVTDMKNKIVRPDNYQARQFVYP